MEIFPLSMAIIGGCFFGILLLTRVLRWIQAIQLALKPRSEAAHSAIAFPLVLLLHSGPYILIIAVAATYHILSNPHRPEWIVFFLTVLASQVALIAYSFVLIRRHRKGLAKNSAP